MRTGHAFGKIAELVLELIMLMIYSTDWKVTAYSVLIGGVHLGQMYTVLINQKQVLLLSLVQLLLIHLQIPSFWIKGINSFSLTLSLYLFYL